MTDCSKIVNDTLSRVSLTSICLSNEQASQIANLEAYVSEKNIQKMVDEFEKTLKATIAIACDFTTKNNPEPLKNSSIYIDIVPRVTFCTSDDEGSYVKAEVLRNSQYKSN